MNKILFLIGITFLLSSCSLFTKTVYVPVIQCPEPPKIEDVSMYDVVFSSPSNTGSFVCLDKNNSVNMLSDIAILKYQLNSCNKILDGYRK